MFVMRPTPIRCALENPGLEIDIRPVQAEYFALAEAERECNRPSCSVTAFPSRTEDALNLRDGVGLNSWASIFGTFARVATFS